MNFFKKAHQQTREWMDKQDKYPSMYSYSSYRECFLATVRSLSKEIRESKQIAEFYTRHNKSLRAARMMD